MKTTLAVILLAIFIWVFISLEKNEQECMDLSEYEKTKIDNWLFCEKM